MSILERGPSPAECLWCLLYKGICARLAVRAGDGETPITLGNATVLIAFGKNPGGPGVEEEKDEGAPRGVSNYFSKVIVVIVA